MQAAKLVVSRAQGEYEALEQEGEEGRKRELEGDDEGRAGKKAKTDDDEEGMEMEMDEDEEDGESG